MSLADQELAKSLAALTVAITQRMPSASTFHAFTVRFTSAELRVKLTNTKAGMHKEILRLGGEDILRLADDANDSSERVRHLGQVLQMPLAGDPFAPPSPHQKMQAVIVALRERVAFIDFLLAHMPEDSTFEIEAGNAWSLFRYADCDATPLTNLCSARML